MTTDIDYTLSIEALRRALDSLQPSDRVEVNAVRNLRVLRDGAYCGFINIRGAYDHAATAFERAEEK